MQPLSLQRHELRSLPDSFQQRKQQLNAGGHSAELGELAVFIAFTLLSYFEPPQYTVAPLCHSASESSTWL